MTRRGLVEAAAVVASLALAAVLALLVLDVRTWQHRLAADDVRFDGGSQSTALWHVSTRLGGAARGLLGVGDDVAYRRALQAFQRAHPGENAYRPDIERLRSEAQQDLTAVGRDDPSRVRRSRALNMLGILSYPSANTQGFDPVERQQKLAASIGLFQDAVSLDPTSAEAKQNLEWALRDEGAFKLPGTDPTGSSSHGAGVGGGRRGGGY